jgi:hypothetical protein
VASAAVHARKEDLVNRIRAILIALTLGIALVAVPAAAHAAPGDTQFTCGAIPNGWVIIMRGAGGCVTIEQVAGYPVGTSLTVCESSPLPAGWVIVYSGFTSSWCNPNPTGTGYGWQVRRTS